MATLNEIKRTMDRYEVLSKQYLETKKGWMALSDIRSEIDVDCIDWLRLVIPVAEAAYDFTYGTGADRDELDDALCAAVKKAFPVDPETLEPIGEE